MRINPTSNVTFKEVKNILQIYMNYSLKKIFEKKNTDKIYEMSRFQLYYKRGKNNMNNQIPLILEEVQVFNFPTYHLYSQRLLKR